MSLIYVEAYVFDIFRGIHVFDVCTFTAHTCTHMHVCDRYNTPGKMMILVNVLTACM